MSRAAASRCRVRGQVSAQLLEQLADRGHGSVEGVFSAGFNVVIDGKLLYVGSSAAPLSCVGAALPAADLAALRSRITAGDLVFSAGKVLRIYDQAGVSQLDLASLEHVDMSLALARPDAIDAHASDALSRGLLELDLVSTIGLSPDERLREHLLALADRRAEGPDLDAAIAFLLGRGLGLTPSGDDMLMGLGVARWLQRCERPLLAALQRARLDRTTPVARAYLQALIAGAANGDYLDLVHALAEVRPDRYAAILKRIRAMGHTSGADSLFGFAIGWGLDVDELLGRGGRTVASCGFSPGGCRIGALNGSMAGGGAASAAAAPA